MAVSTITLTINPSSTIETFDDVSLTLNNGANNFTLSERYVSSVRYRPNTVAILNDFDNVSNATNLANAINLDAVLNNYDLFATSNLNVVTITSNSYTTISVTGTMVTNSKLTSNIVNQTLPINKTVTLVEYNAGNPSVCEDIDAVINVTGGTGLYSAYLDNVLIQIAQVTPLTIPLKRGVNNAVRIVDSLGELIGTITTNAPRKLLTNDISIGVVNLTTGANITVTVPFISQYVNPYTYSLDGVNYISSNIFTSVASGNYTVYVKDALGCVTSKDVVIDGVTTLQNIIFSISEINPIRYSKYEENAKKNYENTLSNDSLRLVNYCFKQEFLSSDIITTQFKTNAKYINVYALQEDLTTTPLTVLKKTDNLGKVAKSTSTYFDMGDGKSAIYFGAVNLLNPTTDAIIGDFDFGFALPIWANKVGNYVTVEGIGELKIDNIVYSDFYESFVLQFNVIYSGSPIAKKISANYNLQNYEVYEFKNTMSLMPNEFNVVIEVGKSINEIQNTYISEKITKVNDSKFLFNIDYWNTVNVGDYVYQTGVKNKIRLQGYVDNNTQVITEGYNGDTQYYVTNNEIYRTETFVFLGLPFQLAHKLTLIMSHDNLFINGIGYKITEEPEINGEKSYNLKNFYVTLKPNGNYFVENVDEVIVGGNLQLQFDLNEVKNKKLLLWSNS